MQVLSALAGLSGFTAVGLGAFGAHALSATFTEKAQGWWETATLYLLVHAAVALACGLSGRGGLVPSAGFAFVLGSAVFAGTLYAMALGAPRWFGAVTPIGGTILLIGWAMVVIAAVRAAPIHS